MWRGADGAPIRLATLRSVWWPPRLDSRQQGFRRRTRPSLRRRPSRRPRRTGPRSGRRCRRRPRAPARSPTSARRRSSLASERGRNPWPPQPGLTVMQSTRSKSPTSSEIGLHGRARAERHARPAARVAHRRQRVVGVRGRLDVDRDAVGPGLRELRDVALRALDHQVHVDVAARVVDLAGERLDHRRAHAERRDEVAVHHVDVDRARAGGQHRADLLAEPGEVRRQDRRRDARGRARHQIGWSIELRQWLHA